VPSNAPRRAITRSGEPAGAAFEVVLASTGQVVAVPSGTSILSAVERAGVQVLSSCREGTCGTCETGVLAGVPDHRDCVLTEAERAVGDVMMICVSRSRGARLVLDFVDGAVLSVLVCSTWRYSCAGWCGFFSR
jgi:ferredoxin